MLNSQVGKRSFTKRFTERLGLGSRKIGIYDVEGIELSIIKLQLSWIGFEMNN